MDWEDMRIFLAVAHASSLTAAGRVLRKDPGTAGRRNCWHEAIAVAQMQAG